MPTTEPKKPDAVLFPDTFKKGKSSLDRTTHVQRELGPRLGGSDHTSLGAAHGGRVYSRDVGGGMFLATLSPEDTLLFPSGHDHARRPRYRWEDQPDGTKHGFLLTAEELEGGKA
jgi:hypothetical protein